MTEKLDVISRATGMLDAYWAVNGRPGRRDIDMFHLAIMDQRNTWGGDFDDAVTLVHDAAGALGWTIVIVNGRIERLVRPGTP